MSLPGASAQIIWRDRAEERKWPGVDVGGTTFEMWVTLARSPGSGCRMIMTG